MSNRSKSRSQGANGSQQPIEGGKRRHRVESRDADVGTGHPAPAVPPQFAVDPAVTEQQQAEADRKAAEAWGLTPVKAEKPISEKLLAAVLVLTLLLGFGVVVMKKFRFASANPNGNLLAKTPDDEQVLPPSDPFDLGGPAAPVAVADAGEPDPFAAIPAAPSYELEPVPGRGPSTTAADPFANVDIPAPPVATSDEAYDPSPADWAASAPVATESNVTSDVDPFAAVAAIDRTDSPSATQQPPAVDAFAMPIGEADANSADIAAPASFAHQHEDDWAARQPPVEVATPDEFATSFEPSVAVEASVATNEPAAIDFGLGSNVPDAAIAPPASPAEPVDTSFAMADLMPPPAAAQPNPVVPTSTPDLAEPLPSDFGRPEPGTFADNGWSEPVDTTPSPVRHSPEPIGIPFESAAPPERTTALSTTPVDVASPTSSHAETYVLQEGDNFYTLSKEHYGTVRYFGALAYHNRARVPDTRRMKLGTEIELPGTETLDAIMARFGGTATPAAALKPERGTIVQTSGTTDLVGVEGFFVRDDGTPCYRIGADETLSGISQKTLGRASRWRQIAAMNVDALEDPNRLKPGVVIVLPHDAAVVQQLGR